MSATEAPTDSLIRRLRREQSGFTLIEVIVATFVLTIGVLGMMLGFDTARKLSLVTERHTTMTHVAQREIERLEGIQYAQIGLTSAPATSTDPTDPDYYVLSTTPPSYEYTQLSGTSEPLDIDATNGTITPVQSWSEGMFSGEIYDYVTWVTDSHCSPGCPGSEDYKRLTVAVTMGGGLQPLPFYSSTVIADPAAEPVQGIANGSTGNPLTNPTTTCANGLGVTGSCISPIDSGNPDTFYLHDWSATGGSPQQPSADSVTHATVGVLGGLLCTTSQLLAGLVPADILGCPTPDLMDSNAPTGGTNATLYHYSTDQASDSAYPGGRLLQPTCSNGTGCGTGATSDCSGGNWASNLLSVQTGFWVSAPLSASLTLTGDGGLSMFTQTLGGADAVVSFCIEIYDVPPDGSSGSLSDILAWPPVALGGAGYVPATDPVSGSNWPTGASELADTFNFRGSSGGVSIAAGDRIGVRIWMKANLNSSIDLLYDNPNYPTAIQLNTQ